MDNTRKMLEVSEPQIDGDVDLYCDEGADGAEQQVVVGGDESPRSVIWEAHGSAAVTARSNGSSLRESHGSRSSSDSKMPGRRSRGDKRLEEANCDAEGQVEPVDPSLSSCTDGDSLHGVPCAGPQVSRGRGRLVTQVKEAAAAQRSPPVSEETTPVTPPISYHDCCDLTKLDPRVLCHSCRVFHTKPCRESKSCRSEHDSSLLGRCRLCDAWCSRKPLVLCRYCGSEYCNACWYRNPVSCSCGQTFDPSSSV